jgi:hypothetical protein
LKQAGLAGLLILLATIARLIPNLHPKFHNLASQMIDPATSSPDFPPNDPLTTPHGQLYVLCETQTTNYQLFKVPKKLLIPRKKPFVATM